MSKVAIVTDSTATIPKEYLDQFHITVAPQIIIWGEETLLDGIDIEPTEFYTRLASSQVLPTTSQVSVASFQEIFTQLNQDGFEILCILISSKLSGTISSAEQAKQLVPQAIIEIVDSQTIAMALGFAVIEAAKTAKSGASISECKAVAENATRHTGIVVTPETLEYLHRGGRIGGGARFLGTALNIKPILELQNGRLEALERVRTRKKVLKRLIDITEERIGGRKPVRLAALHADCPQDAQAVLDEAANRLNAKETVITEVSPVIGVHIGPGTVGLIFMAGV